jgi:hypothetical protein
MNPAVGLIYGDGEILVGAQDFVHGLLRYVQESATAILQAPIVVDSWHRDADIWLDAAAKALPGEEDNWRWHGIDVWPFK